MITSGRLLWRNHSSQRRRSSTAEKWKSFRLPRRGAGRRSAAASPGGIPQRALAVGTLPRLGRRRPRGEEQVWIL